MKKKVAIIGLYYHPEMPSRVEMVYSFYKEMYETRIITSDFVHPYKHYDRSNWKGCVKIHVPEYKTNFSVQRILSHLSYARQIDRQLDEFQPDLVYICVPPNYSALTAVKWARRHKVLSIIDIIDIWPNANAPVNMFFGLAYKVWGSIRDNAVCKADKVLLECSVYNDSIPKVVNTIIPLCKRVESVPNYESHEGIKIAYLGSFSTSYDFESLVYIAKKIKEKGRLISVSLTGKGAKKEEVIRMLKEAEIETMDYGVVFDEEEKAKILWTCDFGFNGFKPGMVVGQSYKSLDYMGCGLALINSLQGDLKNIIESENCGFNFTIDSRDKVVDLIVKMTKQDIESMKNNSFVAYNRHFSWNVYVEEMNRVMKELSL